MGFDRHRKDAVQDLVIQKCGGQEKRSLETWMIK